VIKLKSIEEVKNAAAEQLRKQKELREEVERIKPEIRKLVIAFWKSFQGAEKQPTSEETAKSVGVSTEAERIALEEVMHGGVSW